MLDSLSQHFIDRIPEISYLLSTILMLFVGDYIIGKMLIRRLRRMDFVSRTVIFLLCGLVALPGLTALGAQAFRDWVLAPYKDWIIVILSLYFLFVGIVLSIKYNMKMGLKVR